MVAPHFALHRRLRARYVAQWRGRHQSRNTRRRRSCEYSWSEAAVWIALGGGSGSRSAAPDVSDCGNTAAADRDPKQCDSASLGQREPEAVAAALGDEAA